MAVLIAQLPFYVTENATALSPLPIQYLIYMFSIPEFLLYSPLFIVTILLFPVMFILQFWLLHDKKYFLTIQIGLLVVIWILTPLYFWASWDYGIKWMGQSHTYSVVAEHIISLLLLSGLAIWARKSAHLAKVYLLNILLFCFLIWGAFPVLGELP